MKKKTKIDGIEYVIYKPGEPLLHPKATPKEDLARFLVANIEYIAKWIEPEIRKHKQ
jgi:hypothetical protein